MPELPELEVYRKRLGSVLSGRAVTRVRVVQPFVLRTVEPAIESIEGKVTSGVQREGKRLGLEFGSKADRCDLWIHLMRAGRLHWKRGVHAGRSKALLVIEFDDHRLEMTEAGKRRQASVHVLRKGESVSRGGGLDPLAKAFTWEALRDSIRRRNRQIKGALRDASVITGIGNAYSDEILFSAGMSPLCLTGKLTDEELFNLHLSIGSVLRSWIARIDEVTPGVLPTRQSDWRSEFLVHGKFGQPCVHCRTPIARISYAESETHYCPTCQTGGKLLADRRMSRLLRR